MEYKTMQQDVCFVPLESKWSKRAHPVHKDGTINNVLIEFGPCKVHVPEHVAVSLLTAVLKEAVDTYFNRNEKRDKKRIDHYTSRSKNHWTCYLCI